jgi:hypothetical protein
MEVKKLTVVKMFSCPVYWCVYCVVIRWTLHLITTVFTSYDCKYLYFGPAHNNMYSVIISTLKMVKLDQNMYVQKTR